MNLPLAIVDYRLPEEAISILEYFAEVLPFNAHDITFEAVHGHPDIFMSQVDNQLIIAPNSPQYIVDALIHKNISFRFGAKSVGSEVENSTPYNCVSTIDYLIHKEGFTDFEVLNASKNKTFINLPQPFTRCSLFVFGNTYFITSDKGIYNVLINNGLDVLFISSQDVSLPPYKNGFIGGCMGVFGDKIFFSGSTDYLTDGASLKAYIEKNGFQLVELFNGAPLDVGGLFFIS